jgi:O-antigen ligase
VDSINRLAQKNSLGTVVIVAIIAVLMGLISPIEYLPFFLGALAFTTILVLWANFGDLLTLVLFWFIAVACFTNYFWRFTVALPSDLGFVNMHQISFTIDRLWMLFMILATVLAIIIGRLPIKPMPKVIQVILVLLLYFTLSLLHSGFKSIAEVTPHFRLVGGYYFPLIVLVITYLAFNDQLQIKKICWFFLLFGIYLTFTAWAEHFKLWSIVFPKYIANSEYGIHWGRARGPFLVSASLGVTLIFCFFNNLYLASKTQGIFKPLIHIVNLLMLPAIFFTLTRSVWLAMIVCAFMWICLTYHLRSRIAVMMLALVVMVLGGALFWQNIFSGDRSKGGVTDPFPVYARVGLAKMTWQVFSDHPLFGVGFGHFRDYASKQAQDPSSKYVRYGSQQMEHNNFLSVLAESGVVGLAIYVTTLIVIFRQSLKLYRSIPPDESGWVSRDLVILYWILMAEYLIDGMFRETSVDPFNNGLFFAFTGLILAVSFMQDTSRYQALADSASRQL